MAEHLLDQDGNEILQEDGSSFIELEYLLVNWWPQYPNVIRITYEAVASGEQV